MAVVLMTFKREDDENSNTWELCRRTDLKVLKWRMTRRCVTLCCPLLIQQQLCSFRRKESFMDYLSLSRSLLHSTQSVGRKSIIPVFHLRSRVRSVSFNLKTCSPDAPSSSSSSLTTRRCHSLAQKSRTSSRKIPLSKNKKRIFSSSSRLLTFVSNKVWRDSLE
jgi:hypothetical protein